MRILIFTDDYLPNVGGGQINVFNLDKHLKGCGHSTTIFTNTIDEFEDKDNEKNIIRVSWPSRSVSGIFALAERIYKLLKDYDLVYAQYSYRLSAVVALVNIFRRKPFVIYAQGLGTIIDKEHSFKHRVYRFIALKLADGVIASSRELGDISKKFNKNVLVLPNGIDFDNLKHNLQEEQLEILRNKYKNNKVILTVRRLVAKNGIQYLIEAMPFVVESNKSVKYIVIGEGPKRLELEKRIKELKLDNYVELLGRIDNEEVYKYMKIADVVVFPSSAEAMSIACVEAMAVGTAVVATKVGGLIELIGGDNERGALVDLFDRDYSVYSAPAVDSIEEEKYKEFAGEIVEAFSQEKVAKDRILNAKKFSEENYNWNILVKKILKFTEENTKSRSERN